MQTHTVFISIGFVSLLVGVFYFLYGDHLYASAFLVDGVAFLLLGCYLRWKSRRQ